MQATAQHTTAPNNTCMHRCGCVGACDVMHAPIRSIDCACVCVFVCLRIRTDLHVFVYGFLHKIFIELRANNNVIVFYVLNKTWETRASASFLLMRAHVQRCCTDRVCNERCSTTAATMDKRTHCVPRTTRDLWVFRRLIPAGEIAPCFRWRTRHNTNNVDIGNDDEPLFVAVIFCFRTHFCGFELHTLSRAEMYRVDNVSCSEDNMLHVHALPWSLGCCFATVSYIKMSSDRSRTRGLPAACHTDRQRNQQDVATTDGYYMDIAKCVRRCFRTANATRNLEES